MGLCKCRKVTNLFCFECRKNVCETCMVTDHPTCVVRSYLEWLKDSDVRKVCVFCDESVGPNADNALRLTCYEFAHERCFAKYIESMPRRTAPAGYVCRSCKTPLFAVEQASPVALELRKTLTTKGLIPPTVAWTIEGVAKEALAEGATANTHGGQSAKVADGLGGWDTLEHDLDDAKMSLTSNSFNPEVPSSSTIPPMGISRPTRATVDMKDSVQAKLDMESMRSFLNIVNGVTPQDRRRRRRIGAVVLILVWVCYLLT